MTAVLVELPHTKLMATDIFNIHYKHCMDFFFYVTAAKSALNFIAFTVVQLQILQLFKPCLCHTELISWAQHRQYQLQHCEFQAPLCLCTGILEVFYKLYHYSPSHMSSPNPNPQVLGMTSWKYIKHTYFQREQGRIALHTHKCVKIFKYK